MGREFEVQLKYEIGGKKIEKRISHFRDLKMFLVRLLDAVRVMESKPVDHITLKSVKFVETTEDFETQFKPL